MNDYGRRYLIEQLNRHDYRRSGGGDNRGDMRGGYDQRGGDMRNDMRSGDMRGYGDGMDYYDEMDSRRGVRGSGRRDYEDGHGEKMRLTKADMNHWKHNMENTDGTRGEHYSMQQVMDVAEKLGIKFREFDEKQFCLAMNMIYSDYGHIIKRLVPDKEKEALVVGDFARAYFDDPDGPEPSEKLAIHYHCLTNLG